MTEEFTQWTGTTRTYHADHLGSDGSHLPIISKPEWSIEHSPEDSNVRQVLGTIELSTDATSARIKTGDQPGVITVTVRAQASPTAFASKEFTIAVRRYAPVTTSAFTITQSRNGSINH
jgi:hypothetical protein